MARIIGVEVPPNKRIDIALRYIYGIGPVNALEVLERANIDPAIRAFDVETGKEIWKFDLPTSGAATPMTYQVRPGGKQFVVIAAGGHAKVTEEKQSDEIVAFPLP